MKPKLIVIGSGGHSKATIDIILENKEYDLVGIVDKTIDKNIFGIPVIGTDEDLNRILESGVKNAFVAIGDNVIREKICKNLEKIGYNLINVISNFSKISSNAVLGKGIVVMNGAVINADSKIADGCIINTSSHIDHDCNVGGFTHISTGTGICGSVTIGKKCFICTGATIIDKISICDEVVVGAGAVVIKNIERKSTVVGVPAREINI